MFREMDKLVDGFFDDIDKIKEKGMKDVYTLQMGDTLEGVFVSEKSAMDYREGFHVTRKEEPYKVTRTPVKDKEISVVVWSLESVYIKRELKIDCSVEEAKVMSSEEFSERIVEYVDVLDEEPASGETSFELDELYEVDRW